LVVSIKRSRAIYSGVLSKASHLPIGHASVAMRNFAQVLHPHLRQRPVALSAVASHSGHARHVASRLASASGGVVAKPAREKPATDLRKLENCGLMLDLLKWDKLESHDRDLGSRSSWLPVIRIRLAVC
jgi:hypothetical protein